jgi:UDP-N-acetylglucosamine 2-epimerase (non-hydrolysing)
VINKLRLIRATRLWEIDYTIVDAVNSDNLSLVYNTSDELDIKVYGGIDKNGNSIHTEYNKHIDVLSMFFNYPFNTDYEFKDEALRAVDWDNKRVIVMTAHRRENSGKPLENICKAVLELVNKHEDIEVVYPVHMNPAVRNTVFEILGNNERIKLIEPVNADELHNAIKRGYLVLTDSGGLQEEAPSLGKPVLVLRNETERPEAVEAGTVKIVGTNKAKIIEETTKLLTDSYEYNKMSKSANPYGDGMACERIIEAIRYYFGLTKKKVKDMNLLDIYNKKILN